jgi:hypothetical protein
MKVETGLKAGSIHIRDINLNAQGNTLTGNNSTVAGGNYVTIGGSVGNNANIGSNNNVQKS